MGFDVHVVATLRKPPTDLVVEKLNDQFEEATHARGSKVVEIREHVTGTNAADAIDFVRGLVLDALPDGSTITSISTEED